MSACPDGSRVSFTAPFWRCDAALTVQEACDGIVDDLLEHGFELPSVYLLSGRRLRCQAARGYFQVVDGFLPGTGVIGQILESGRSVRHDDVARRPEFIAAVPGLVAEAGCPVRCDGAVVGVVNVESRTDLPGDTLSLLELAAGRLGRRIQLLGGLPEPSPAEKLAQAGVQIAAATEIEEVERRVVLAAIELSGMSSAAVVRLSGIPHQVVTACGPLAARLRDLRHADLALMASWVTAGTSSHFPGGQDVPPGYGFLRTAQLRALSVHPLVASGTVTGLLLLADASPVACTPAAVGSLEMLANQAAGHLSMAAALQETRLRSRQDELTALGNRSCLHAALQDALDTRRVDEQVGLLLLDLDDFKLVNDSLGHSRGDDLLIEVALRLRQLLREGEVACRIGGDEFTVVLPRTTPAAAQALALRLLDLLSGTATLGPSEVQLTGSIGIALSSDDVRSTERMLKAADLAMYEAKARGKGGYAVFESDMESAALHRVSLEADLRRAVRDGQLTLAYQPIVDLTSGRMSAVEALVRWTHPARGPVSPGEFIPLAEETGLIQPLGDYVLREACDQLQRWDRAGGDPRMKITVNVSTRQLEHHGLLVTLDRCLARGLNPSRLLLEVTETALTRDSGRADKTLQEIRDRGVHIAVDDFGTGYSSLARLRSAPVSRLKIDRSFINEIEHADSHVPIVDATMAMARGLGLGVVAEGVETPAQLGYLRRAGCPQAQGFLLSRPLPPADVLALMHGTTPWQQLLHDDEAASPAMNGSRSGSLVDLAVSPDVDLDSLVRPLLDDLLSMTGMPTAYLTRVDVAADQQYVLCSAGRPETPQPVAEGMSAAWSESLCRRALTTGPSATNDAQAAYRDTDLPVDLGIRAFITEPVLGADGGLYGTLCALSTSERVLTQTDTASVRMMARLVTEKLRQLSVADAQSQQPAAERASRAQQWPRRWAAAARWEEVYLQHLTATGTAPEDDLAWQAYAARRSRQAQLPAPDLADRRVVVADATGQVRALLAQHLGRPGRATAGLRLAADAATDESAVGTVVAEQPDVLVLGCGSETRGIEQVISDVRAFAPGTRILLYAEQSGVQLLGQRLDVDRALSQDDGADRLIEALTILAD